MKKLFILLLAFNLNIKCHSQIAKKDLKKANEYYESGNVKYDAEDYKGAIIDYNKCIEINPKAKGIYDNMGSAKLNIGDVEGAEKDFSKAIEINPKDYVGYIKRGMLKAGQKNNKGAIEDYNKVIELKPQEEQAYYYRGISKHALGLKEEGCLDLNIALKFGSKEAKKVLDKDCK